METQRVSSEGQTKVTLDSLSRLDAGQLDRLYRVATLSSDMAAVSGQPTGRMLAIRGLDKGPPAGVLRSFAASKVFPWGGKSFSARTKSEGDGINRVRLGRTFEWFPFKTLFGPSVIDGKPALILDYDQPGNPYFIRKIHDEVREAAPGIFFGPACWKMDPKPAVVLWFALDNRKI